METGDSSLIEQKISITATKSFFENLETNKDISVIYLGAGSSSSTLFSSSNESDESNKSLELPQPPISTRIGRTPLPEEIIDRILSRQECSKCFCQPCVMDSSNRQSWWPTQQCQPNTKNFKERYKLYRVFFNMLFFRQVFSDPRYKERKQLALNLSKKVMKFSNRDIIPDCVVHRVRYWFPNPPKMSYVGHLWEEDDAN